MNGHKAANATDTTAPASLADLLGQFRGCFSAWTFPTFCALACGLLAQTGRRTVCGMLVGARLSQAWSHHRAHRFFSHARWSVEAVSAVLAGLVVRLLIDPGEAVTIAVDDTLFARAARRCSPPPGSTTAPPPATRRSATATTG